MSDKELLAATLIPQCLEGILTTKGAAERLAVDGRTIRRMKEKVRTGGTSALAHALRGRKGNRRIPKEEIRRMEYLLRTRYPDFTPTFAAEKLADLHGLVHDPKTVRAAMLRLGLWKARKGAATVIHREWRERRPLEGELVQYDGSYEAWFEDRLLGDDGLPLKACLLAAIDDATGKFMRAEFALHEGVLPTMGFWAAYAREHGLPEAIYLDRFSTYRMHMDVAAENPDTKTQFGRSMGRLGVKLIFALSPQAKGRVERLFRTLQDRLVKELRLRGISTMREADRFLHETFIPDFNRRFSHEARVPGNRHRPLTAHERDALDTILCREDPRTVLGDFTVPHGKSWYQLLPTPRLAIRPKDIVHIRTAADGTVSIWLRGKAVRWRTIDKVRGTGPKKERKTSVRKYALIQD
jgi:transposase